VSPRNFQTALVYILHLTLRTSQLQKCFQTLKYILGKVWGQEDTKERE